MKCPSCNGTGDMPQDQIEDSDEPVCVRFGCQTCDGLGEIEDDNSSE